MLDNLQVTKFPGATVAIGVASASVALVTDAASAKARFMRIATTSAAYVRWGVGAQTAVAGDLLVQPGDAVVVQVNGADTIACLQVAAAGVLVATPLDNAR